MEYHKGPEKEDGRHNEQKCSNVIKEGEVQTKDAKLWRLWGRVRELKKATRCLTMGFSLGSPLEDTTAGLRWTSHLQIVKMRRLSVSSH